MRDPQHVGRWLVFVACLSPGVAGADGVTGDAVAAVALRGSDVYVGGDFSFADDRIASGVARWDGACWSQLWSGSGIAGIDGVVNAIAIDGNGWVYVAGDLRAAGESTVSNIAVWDGARWQALGAGVNGTVRALAIGANDELFVGGQFTMAGGLAVNNLARWDGTQWSDVGGGVTCRDNSCRPSVGALVYTGSILYVGGAFYEAGPIGAANLAAWNGTWTVPSYQSMNQTYAVGFDSRITALAVGDDGTLYIGGLFRRGGVCGRSAGNAPNCDQAIAHIARLDARSVGPLGQGTNGDVFAVATRGDAVYVGGDFAFVFGSDGTSIKTGSIATWSNGWTPMASGIGGPVASIAVSPRAVFAGGVFPSIGHVAQFDGVEWTPLGCSFEVPIEGGIRARAEIDPRLASPLPSVRVDGVPATNVAVSRDSAAVYFTPPPHAPALADVVIANAAMTTTLPNFISYTDDTVRGVRAVEKGLLVRYRELLAERPDDLVQLAPADGAVAEVLIHGILSRVSAPLGVDRVALSRVMVDMGLHLRDTLNDERPPNADFAAIFRPLTYGQTVHHRFEPDPSERVLLTLGPGSLTVKAGRDLVPTIDITEGTIFLRGEFDTPRRLTTTFYGFDLRVAGRRGLIIEELVAFKPQDNTLQYIAPRLGPDRILAQIEDTTPEQYGFRESDLSHIFVGGEDTPIALGDGEASWLTAFVASAVYRQNLDLSSHQGNVAKPALVSRQSYVLVRPYADFEPAHCLLNAHIFPRVSFSLSQPNGPAVLAPDSVRIDYRLDLEPQRGPGAQYVAGFFKDNDRIPLWFDAEPCQFPDCMPAPFWWAIFNPAGTLAPVPTQTLVTSDDTDNIHLHRVHEDTTLPPWSGPIVEAPGSFNGTIHLHWRWGEGFGESFGGGRPLFQDNQKWDVALTHGDIVSGVADFKTQVQELINGGLRSDITTTQKTLFVGCQQSQLQPHIQYETFSTGFGFALGTPAGLGPQYWPPGHPCPGRFLCPLADFVSRHGGYYGNTIGFGGAMTPTLGIITEALQPLVNALLSQGDLKLLCVPGHQHAFPNGPIEQCRDGFQGPAPEGSLCSDVALREADLGKRTPLSLTAGDTTVTIRTTTTAGAAFVAQKVFVLADGYSLTEPVGRPGATLEILFDPPVRVVRWLPIAVRDKTGPGAATVTAYRGANALGTFPVTGTVFEGGGRFAEAFLDINVGEPLDRLTITSNDRTKELGIAGFEVCSAPIPRGDLDRDGDLDSADLDPLIRCFSGPNLQGFACRDADLDGDLDVDCDDLQLFSTNANVSGCDADGDGLRDLCDDDPPPSPSASEDGGCDCSATETKGPPAFFIFILAFARRRGR